MWYYKGMAILLSNLGMIVTGPVEFRKRTDEDIRHHAKKHEALRESGFLTKEELDVMMTDTGVKFPSEFSRLPYWDEGKDYLIDLMHLIKNLGEHIVDTTMGVDFDHKTRAWAEERRIKPDWWETGKVTPQTQ